MPNWRNPSEYDFVDELDGPSLAWEFLRRNQGYKFDFEGAFLEEADWVEFNARNVSPNDWNPATYYLPDRESNESHISWVIRAIREGGVPRALSPTLYYAQKWNIVRLVDPRENKRPTFRHPRNYPKLADESVRSDISDDGEQTGKIAVFEIDLSMSNARIFAKLGPKLDLEKATRGIETIQRRKSRVEEKLLLRILDAIEKGEKRSVIAEFIYSNEIDDPVDQLNKHRTTAESLCSKYAEVYLMYEDKLII